MGKQETLRVNGQRLWASLMALARIGATDKGGVRRLALTDLDREARDLFCAWAREAGLELRIDRVGNLFARRPGTDPSRRAVMAGSHIDTQPSGGKFDGNYGVLAALEVMRTLDDATVRTAAPLEVAVWTNEEGSRFQPVMMGSGAFAGAFSVESVLAARDLDGRSVGEELARIGYAGGAACGEPRPEAYFEAHIEQGPVLEDTATTIGVVSGVMGLRWFRIGITGQDAHAGPTPMHLRRDALLAAARVVEAVHRIALDHAPDGRGTVGFIQASPNSINVVPGEARLSADLRHADAATLDTMEAALREACAAIGAATGTAFSIEAVSRFESCRFDPVRVEGVRRAAAALGLSSRPIVSGAGHDAVHLARVAPTAMIFVPCEGGLSHNELENARPEHLEAGCNVLLHAMLEAAG